MWQAFMKHIPSFNVWIGAAASLVIPLFFTWLNKTIREWGNPPWLQKQTPPDSAQQQSQQQSTGSSQQQSQQETSNTPQQ